MCSRAAARPKWSSSATATKYRRCLSSMVARFARIRRSRPPVSAPAANRGGDAAGCSRTSWMTSPCRRAPAVLTRCVEVTYFGPMDALLATAAELHLGNRFPIWSVVPFVGDAALDRRDAPLRRAALGGQPNKAHPQRGARRAGGHLDGDAASPRRSGHAASEYLAFIVMLGALFVIACGIVVRGTAGRHPWFEHAPDLAIGAVLASIIGTTGASMLLVRPLLRANSVRRARGTCSSSSSSWWRMPAACSRRWGTRRSSSASCAACPSPGRCASGREWLLVNGVLLILFYMVDSTHHPTARTWPEPRGPGSDRGRAPGPLRSAEAEPRSSSSA